MAKLRNQQLYISCLIVVSQALVVGHLVTKHSQWVQSPGRLVGPFLVKELSLFNEIRRPFTVSHIRQLMHTGGLQIVHKF
jgi:hypothetical protein